MSAPAIIYLVLAGIGVLANVVLHGSPITARAYNMWPRLLGAFVLPALLVLWFPIGRADAHEAPAGWKYDNYCCGGQDCQPIRVEQVEITPEGYRVTIPNGGHITARRDHVKTFGWDEVRRSGDEHYHACILPNSQELRCLYVPQFGA